MKRGPYKQWLSTDNNDIPRSTASTRRQRRLMQCPDVPNDFIERPLPLDVAPATNKRGPYKTWLYGDNAKIPKSTLASRGVNDDETNDTNITHGSYYEGDAGNNEAGQVIISDTECYGEINIDEYTHSENASSCTMEDTLLSSWSDADTDTDEMPVNDDDFVSDECNDACNNEQEILGEGASASDGCDNQQGISEIILLIFAFVVRHSLTDYAITDLLSLLKALSPY